MLSRSKLIFKIKKMTAEQEGDMKIVLLNTLMIFTFFTFLFKIKLECPMACKCHWKEAVVLLM